MRNRVGLSTSPWGTPALRLNVSPLCLFTLTYAFLDWRKLFSSLTIFFSTPDCISLYIIASCHTLSKAFCTSLVTIVISVFLSVPFSLATLSYKLARRVVVPLRFLKPCCVSLIVLFLSKC
ncbi:unnamed protein product [Meganyctiphanes norvegica]|uniref:Uncharacterized protein n=1 Tax=Meganyctiphanes norvegica TaxID=48144 RepID=A0AAV2QIL0_MEGNR